MSIYFSTGGYKNNNTNDIVEKFIDIGIKNIELSGTQYSDNNIDNIAKNLKFVNYQIHNYFPPPKIPFVLNLASFDKEIYERTHKHIVGALEACSKLNSSHYSFHAGFLCDLKVSELGKKVKKKNLQDRKSSIDIFISRVHKISDIAKKYNIKLMIENNVLSKNNKINFEGNPFLMCDALECETIINECPTNVRLLIDVAHLKVSSNSLDFDKKLFLERCNDITEGYHLSENNGLSDTNEKFDENAWFWDHIRKDKKYYSIEVYNASNEEIKNLYELTKKKINKQ